MIFSWLIAALCFLFLEMTNPGLFYFLSFFFGALIAAGVSNWYGEHYIVQIVTFFISSILSFLLLRYWVKREDKNNPKTNVYALQGKKGVVIQDIPKNMVGIVKIGGEIWSAKALNHENIHKGSLIEVIRVQGAHLIVVEITK